MTITKSIEGNNAVFSLEGRLDTVTSPEAQAKLIPEFDQHPNVILDFEKLIYVSSAGLRVLLMAQKTAAAKNGSFTVRNVSDEIMEIFSMTGIAKVLTII